MYESLAEAGCEDFRLPIPPPSGFVGASVAGGFAGLVVSVGAFKGSLAPKGLDGDGLSWGGSATGFGVVAPGGEIFPGVAVAEGIFAGG